MKRIAFALVVTGLAVAGYTYDRGGNTLRAKELTLEVGGDAIYVPDQPLTNTITIGFASPSKNSFVVVSEYTDGVIGKRLGVSELLTAGPNSNIQAPLSRTMQDGETLIAKLYQDDGDQSFSNDDKPLLDASDDEIFALFFASVDAELTIINANYIGPDYVIETPIVNPPVIEEPLVELPPEEPTLIEEPLAEVPPEEPIVVDEPPTEEPAATEEPIVVEEPVAEAPPEEPAVVDEPTATEETPTDPAPESPAP